MTGKPARRGRKARLSIERYEELCTLAAGGLLEGAEFADFQSHQKECSECRASYQELHQFVTGELPQAQSTIRQKLAAMRAKPLDDSATVSSGGRKPKAWSSRPNSRSAPDRAGGIRPVILAPVAALLVVAVTLTVYHFRETAEHGAVERRCDSSKSLILNAKTPRSPRTCPG